MLPLIADLLRRASSPFVPSIDQVKIADFGVSATLTQSKDTAEEVMGTPLWMALPPSRPPPS